jgi:hypothetical protein
MGHRKLECHAGPRKVPRVDAASRGCDGTLQCLTACSHENLSPYYRGTLRGSQHQNKRSKACRPRARGGRADKIGTTPANFGTRTQNSQFVLQRAATRRPGRRVDGLNHIQCSDTNLKTPDKLAQAARQLLVLLAAAAWVYNPRYLITASSQSINTA